ncbi:hypothetical protein NEUTE1DRAFT_43829 [Neurospora tetrasperma FGSC 2508]|uniref:Protamine P1 n=1 Tax=Neurospora tetrasperma (strain FGSC 2508 / ATCC MYA-4615 / P0657) TaxID=510951 RepID=F8MPF6_NEUT8|nr:uncharacterized protein NEUTE1DRAFT_43829 [Neurospora tetrasperma FGSC 2508]EGO57115.1 hypothetical protein NEUTE1DRAFT_43829 [Neurospora tetrasperma FGSC 2508]EGZ69965.1 hypothetical protein NEUTE2DRAFT_69797 [Neurospora tetrasperma FGSC 2509]
MKRRSHLVHGWLTEAFPDEPVYAEAIHTSQDILYSGSEDEAYNSPAERRERYEDKGQRFLQGKPMLLLSASLRGPFTKESGWTNPWRSKSGRQRRIQSQAAHSTPGPAEEESIVIAATPTIFESEVRGQQEQPHLHDEASSRPNTPIIPHRYLDDEILHEIKAWQDTVANQSGLEDPFDENTYEPSSPDTLQSLQVEITPRTHGSRSFIVSSSAVAEGAGREGSVEYNNENIAEQNEEVNLGYSDEEEAGLINVDEDDGSSLTDLDEEQIEELIGDQDEEQETDEDEKDNIQNQGTEENQPISQSLPVESLSDYDSPTKHPITSIHLPQPNGKLDLRPREELECLPVDAIDLSPAAVKIYEESLRGSTCYSPSWPAQERRKQGNLLPGLQLAGATLSAGNVPQSPSNRSGRSLHAPASTSISHDEKRSNKAGSITLEHQTIEPERILVDNPSSEPDETRDSPNDPSDTPAHHQQIIVTQPESPLRVISATDRPQPNAAVTHTVPEITEGEQKSLTTDPTSPSSSELSSPATSFEEEEEESIEEPVQNVRKLLWAKTQRQPSTQDSTPDMALGVLPATASFAQAGPRPLQTVSVSESVESHGEQGSLEYFTINQHPANDREPTNAGQNALNSQSSSRLLQSQPQSAPEATVSEESIYDDTINQVRLEWPTGASSLPHQSQVQTQNSAPVASIEEPLITGHDTSVQRITPDQPKRSVNVMDLRHITNPTSRNATPLRPSPGLQNPFTTALEIPVLVQPRSSVTPESPVNPEPSRSQLSIIASQALAQAVQPVIQQSPWVKGDSQIAFLAVPAPEPRCVNPASSPLSSPASSSCFVDMEDPVLPVLSYPPVPGNDSHTEEETAVPPAQAETPQLQVPHPPSTPETKRSSLPTPEFTMSIKSFKHFMTPSPKRPAKRPRLSLGDGRLPDTQALEEAVVTNPWDSSRVELAAPSRRTKRVSWAPLPGEVDYMDPDMSADMDVDMEDPDQPSSLNRMKIHGPRRSILSVSAPIANYRGIPRRAASPPPNISMPSVDSLPKESQRFGKHFAAVSGRRRLAPKPPTTTPTAAWYRGDDERESPMLRDVSGNARSTGTSRPAKRLLPSESQQTCGSPAVDGMANAFVQADRQTENLNLNRRKAAQDGIPTVSSSSSSRGIWQDPIDAVSEPQQKDDNDDDDRFRLPTLPGLDSQPQVEEMDEVTEVMDNLDDFIDSWDIDEELAEARGEKTKKKKTAQPSKLGQGLSSGLGDGRNLWDSPSSRPQSTLKRKRAGDDEQAKHGMVESQESTSGGDRGGGIYDPGVWDRIV